MSELETDKPKQTIPFFPAHIMTEARVALGLLILVVIVGVLGSIWPIGLEAQADPMDTPAHAQPEWYFLFLYEMLKYVPKTLGVLIPIGALIAIALWPFFDRKTDTQRAKKVRWVISIVGMLVVGGLTLLAAIG
jgi:quinol-cytochrome oxidoreductase complex cytochrome b subunit